MLLCSVCRIAHWCSVIYFLAGCGFPSRKLVNTYLHRTPNISWLLTFSLSLMLIYSFVTFFGSPIRSLAMNILRMLLCTCCHTGILPRECRETTLRPKNSRRRLRRTRSSRTISNVKCTTNSVTRASIPISKPAGDPLGEEAAGEGSRDSISATDPSTFRRTAGRGGPKSTRRNSSTPSSVAAGAVPAGRAGGPTFRCTSASPSRRQCSERRRICTCGTRSAIPRRGGPR
mmetsp:Transcript_43130/g.131389  ORF Transcript_43130/g.131389 Transcript_43130/m.131389 type:complete len:230 (-) Transcript_43130:839-1528(-)